jgi:hypothetical protein
MTLIEEKKYDTGDLTADDERSNRGRLHIPWNLSEWIPKDALRDWALAEIATLDWSNPEVVAYLEKHPRYRPKEMLVLCAYAYAVGLFESDELVGISQRDPGVHKALADHSPSVREIRRFRKENGGLIRWILMQLLRRTFRERFGLADLVPAGLRRLFEENATARLDIARHMDRAAQGA